MQVVKVVKDRPKGGSKEDNSAKSKYYLGFHPDPRFPFNFINGASLEFVRQHLASFGGKVYLWLSVDWTKF